MPRVAPVAPPARAPLGWPGSIAPSAESIALRIADAVPGGVGSEPAPPSSWPSPSTSDWSSMSDGRLVLPALVTATGHS